MAFKFKDFTSDGEDTKDDEKQGKYKWVYSIPKSFYRVLHKQIKLIAILSLLHFTLICFLPINWYTIIGAPGLVVIAFACWSGMYIGILYLDYTSKYFRKFSFRFLLFLLMIFSSFVNNDHPVRYNNYSAMGQENRPKLKEHFLAWFEKYRNDTNSLYCLRNDTSTMPFYPVVFVCAEGGALRTGAFAAQTLSFLQDSISKVYNVDLSKSIYAFSGVSGGSVGIGFFNALSYLSEKNHLKEGTYTELTKRFFSEDFLSPVIGKMFFADVINLFIPFHVDRFDRAIALEHSWEEAYKKILLHDGENIFANDFRSSYKVGKIAPAVFINTTEIETGKQCWITNVVPDSSMLFAKERDLLAYKIHGGLNYSTAINFSSRFPLFSPAATVFQDETKKLHYVDGGYVENTGAATMLELLKALKPTMDTIRKNYNKRIRPYVLLLEYTGKNDTEHPTVSFANEFSEILYGIYNTRGGRSTTAIEELDRFLSEDSFGKLFTLPLEKKGSDVPMNWVLSSKSLDSISSDIKKKWENKGAYQLNNFFAFDTSCYSCNDTLKSKKHQSKF